MSFPFSFFLSSAAGPNTPAQHRCRPAAGGRWGEENKTSFCNIYIYMEQTSWVREARVHIWSQHIYMKQPGWVREARDDVRLWRFIDMVVWGYTQDGLGKNDREITLELELFVLLLMVGSRNPFQKMAGCGEVSSCQMKMMMVTISLVMKSGLLQWDDGDAVGPPPPERGYLVLTGNR